MVHVHRPNELVSADRPLPPLNYFSLNFRKVSRPLDCPLFWLPTLKETNISKGWTYIPACSIPFLKNLPIETSLFFLLWGGGGGRVDLLPPKDENNSFYTSGYLISFGFIQRINQRIVSLVYSSRRTRLTESAHSNWGQFCKKMVITKTESAHSNWGQFCKKMVITKDMMAIPKFRLPQ